VTKDVVEAYMLFNLSDAAGYEDAGKYREIVGKEMTLEQVAEAQRMTRVSKPKDEAAGH